MLEFLILRPVWALVIALLCALGVQGLMLHSAHVQIANEMVVRAQATQSALTAATEYREKEAALQTQLEDAIHVLQAQKIHIEKLLAAVSADRGRLRKQIADYATSGPAATDSVAACRDRASELGDILGGVLQDYADRTKQAEDRAAEVRALLSAWPIEK